MSNAYHIIDCHIHPAVSSATDFSWFAAAGTFTDQVEALRRAGISQACGAPVASMEPINFADVKALNDAALSLRDQFPDFYIPGIHIHPRFPDESYREIERCLGKEGVRWVGELVGYIMGYGNEYATPDALDLMRAIVTYGAVVNFHCGDLATIETLCTEVPELNLVLAHPGGGKDEFLRRLELVARFPNLHFDLSGSGIDRLGMIRKTINNAGVEKILFGSDYPINNPAVYVHGTQFEDLSPTELTAIFAGNFRRLTGI